VGRRWLLAFVLSSSAGCGLLLDLDPRAEQGGRSDGGMDGGPRGDGCPVSCDDGIDCTLDTCELGRCVSQTMDSLCGPAARCTSTGCEDACTIESCMDTVGPCEAPACAGGSCVPQSLCSTDQTCCGGACTSCDDGNVCTHDSCDGSSCTHGPLAGAGCDDGLYCTGTDACGSDGRCVSTGDPCMDGQLCDEAIDACVVRACVSDAECGPSAAGLWSPCAGFADACATAGTQMRSLITPVCVAGMCTAEGTVELRGCTRSTDGRMCGAVTYGPWSACAGFASRCAEDGMASQTVTTPTCTSAVCTPIATTVTSACFRETDGMACDDSNACTTGETCSGGACFGGTLTCDAGVVRDAGALDATGVDCCTTGCAPLYFCCTSVLPARCLTEGAPCGATCVGGP